MTSWSVVSGDAGFPVESIQVDQFLSNPKSLVGRVRFVVNMSKGVRGPFKKSFVPAVLEHVRIPYLGSDPYVLSFVRNKAHLKAFAHHLGIPTPEFQVVREEGELDMAALPDFPLFVKPCYESSSIGIDQNSKVASRTELMATVRRVVAGYHQPAIVERFLSGAEFGAYSRKRSARSFRSRRVTHPVRDEPRWMIPRVRRRLRLQVPTTRGA